MPLLDHFHPPLKERRAWESFHALWSVALVEHLNRKILPSGYFAETQIHVGGRVEVDIGAFEEETPRFGGASTNGGVATETWAPPTAALIMPAVFPDEFEIEVFQESGGLTLVGAIELVSPGNKDRPETRRAFAAKCAAYLQLGVGLLVIDVVTDRRANLHDELIQLLQQPSSFAFPHSSPLYTVAYRPCRRDPGGDQIDIWPTPLALGEVLPIMPLALRRGPTLPVDLEASYTEARSKGRL
jgi:Protein of unknown function (DUF4058)